MSQATESFRYFRRYPKGYDQHKAGRRNELALNPAITGRLGYYPIGLAEDAVHTPAAVLCQPRDLRAKCGSTAFQVWPSAFSEEPIAQPSATIACLTPVLTRTGVAAPLVISLRSRPI